MRIRHTMGNDWGGRNAVNPKGSRRVSQAEVLRVAAELGFEIKRGSYYGTAEAPIWVPSTGWTNWWWRRPDGVWLTGETTNLLMIDHLHRKAEEEDARRETAQAWHGGAESVMAAFGAGERVDAEALRIEAEAAKKLIATSTMKMKETWNHRITDLIYYAENAQRLGTWA